MFGRRHTLSAEELARDVQSLATDNDNLLAVKQLLSDNAGQTAQQMALAINDNLSGWLVNRFLDDGSNTSCDDNDKCLSC